jgi:signal transduction histidine kinase
VVASRDVRHAHARGARLLSEKESALIPRVSLIVALLALCTAAHFLLPHHLMEYHEFLFKVTYVPIILSALWFGVRGGLITSVATSAVYLVHIQYQLGGCLFSTNLGWTLDLVLYNGIAVVTGILSQAQARARRRAEELAEEQSALRRQLESSYQTLRRQTEELLETTEQLQRAERLAALGELTASIAHEIRNPLSGISGAAEIISRKDVAPETRAEFSDILKKETARLNQAVHNILNFARAHKVKSEEADLTELIRRVTALVAKEAQQHSVAMEQDVAAGLRVRTDALLLEHILLNLLLNAVQAMPEGGLVTVGAQTERQKLRLEVRDNGPGIPTEIQEKVFAPFFTTRPGGTGLGLAIARRIARGMGGEIRLESVVGKGSTFRVELPLTLPPTLTATKDETESHGQENPAG